jgi:hypothetical protein
MKTRLSCARGPGRLACAGGFRALITAAGEATIANPCRQIFRSSAALSVGEDQAHWGVAGGPTAGVAVFPNSASAANSSSMTLTLASASREQIVAAWRSRRRGRRPPPSAVDEDPRRPNHAELCPFNFASGSPAVRIMGAIGVQVLVIDEVHNIADAIVAPLFRQLSRTSRSMPGGRRRLSITHKLKAPSISLDRSE